MQTHSPHSTDGRSSRIGIVRRNMKGCATCRIRKKKCPGPDSLGNCKLCKDLRVECLMLYGEAVPQDFPRREIIARLTQWHRYRGTRRPNDFLNITEFMDTLRRHGADRALRFSHDGPYQAYRPLPTASMFLEPPTGTGPLTNSPSWSHIGSNSEYESDFEAEMPTYYTEDNLRLPSPGFQTPLINDASSPSFSTFYGGALGSMGIGWEAAPNGQTPQLEMHPGQEGYFPTDHHAFRDGAGHPSPHAFHGASQSLDALFLPTSQPTTRPLPVQFDPSPALSAPSFSYHDPSTQTAGYGLQATPAQRSETVNSTTQSSHRSNSLSAHTPSVAQRNVLVGSGSRRSSAPLPTLSTTSPEGILSFSYPFHSQENNGYFSYGG